MPKSQESRPLPILNEAKGARRALTRRQVVQILLAGAGSGLAGMPLIASKHPVHRHLKTESTLDAADAQAAARDWTPKFLSEHQSETLAALAERMIPGSSAAHVNRFIDLLLSVDTTPNQKNFLAALSAFDAAALERYEQPFVRLSPEQLVAILAAASTMEPSQGGRSGLGPWSSRVGRSAAPESPLNLRDHFDHLKGWISGAYYTSEVGMRELGWTGDSFFEEFPGCTHPGGHP
jgi:hypothetical protein